MHSTMTHSTTVIIKFGGSIITKKRSAKPTLRPDIISQLGSELAFFLHENSDTQVILLRGAGSYGHPIVYKYKLYERTVLSLQQQKGYQETRALMDRLTDEATSVLLKTGCPIEPLRTPELFEYRNDLIHLTKRGLIEQALSLGKIPFFGGDILLDELNRPYIILADEIGSYLVKKFRIERLLFATDVNGVLDHFPPGQNEAHISHLSRADIRHRVKNHSLQSHETDVTGGIFGKLNKLVTLDGCETVIFNGAMAGNLLQVLQGKNIGTKITKN